MRIVPILLEFVELKFDLIRAKEELRVTGNSTRKTKKTTHFHENMHKALHTSLYAYIEFFNPFVNISQTSHKAECVPF